MKVLSEYAPAPWSCQIRCSGCRAELLVEAADVVKKPQFTEAEWRSNREARKQGLYCYCVSCPICGTERVLPFDTGLPGAVWQAVWGKKPVSAKP